MPKNIIITGKPKSGKSTLLRKLVANIPNKVGFVTNEILGDEGRLGFEMETHNGHRAVLAHVDFETPNKVSRYSVNIQNFESLLPEVSEFKNDDLLYIDEIGEMELFSKNFEDLVLRYLNSPNICIATFSAVFENDFTKAIKERSDALFIELSPENREEKEHLLAELIEKLRR